MINLNNLFEFEFDFEICCVKFCEENIIICSLYRSPDGNIDIFFEKLEELLQLLSDNSNNRVLIGGDFNINFLIQNHISTLCQNIFASFGFQQQIHSYTRVSKNLKTCIDNIFVNFDSTSSTEVDHQLSDYYGIQSSFLLNSEPEYSYSRYRSMMNDNNMLKTKTDLKNIEWVKILENVPEENKFDVFFEIFDKTVTSNMPVKEKKFKSNTKLWFYI